MTVLRFPQGTGWVATRSMNQILSLRALSFHTVWVVTRQWDEKKERSDQKHSLKRGFTFVLLGRYIPLGTSRDGLIIMVVHVYKSWSRAQSAHCGCPGALVGGASVSSNSLQARGAAIKCSSLKAAHFFFFPCCLQLIGLNQSRAPTQGDLEVTPVREN